MNALPCVCCGHLVFESVGSYEICPLCFWEDDLVQLRWPTHAGGANSTSLVQAQVNYQAFGACDENDRQQVRPALPGEPVDTAWRLIDLARDLFEDWESSERAPWPQDASVLCWWLPTFWRRDQPLVPQ
ncbi:CPCC family cysteine-rich protein [Streptomyces sparsogenes]|uniref:CPCC family cysteine-rich protein n=1 Tax=Streptomyces sparsogenes TaxID=67365 RepID=UPI00332120A2